MITTDATAVGYNPERSDMPKKLPTKNPAAQALGRLGGSAGTSKQNRARKRNAQLAGRPRRVCNHCHEPVIGGHTDRALDETCGEHGWHWHRRNQPTTPLTVADIEAEIESHHQAVADLQKLLSKRRRGGA